MKPLALPPTVLVTGASSGIGRATAALLARSGMRVFGTSRRPVVTAPVEGVTFLPLDVRDPASIACCLRSVLEHAGRIDALINNAGQVGPGSASEEVDLQHVRDLFETNFFGVVQMTNAVLPILRLQRSGTIINISSVVGRVPLPPFFTFYAASKHALEAYTEGLRYEVRPFGIHVAMIEPGFTATSIGAHIQPPDHPIADYDRARWSVTLLDRFGIAHGSTPEVVAQAVLRALRHPSPALRIATGDDARAILLARRLLPDRLFEALGRWLFLSWRPEHSRADIALQPTPAELGLRRLLFDGPTLQRVLRVALLAGAALAGAGLFFLRKVSTRPRPD